MPSWMRTLKTTGQRHAVGLRVCVGLALVAMVGGVLQAAPAKRSRKARGCVMTQDPTAMEQFVSFLRAYHQAVSGADRGFVAAHTVFPLPFASSDPWFWAQAPAIRAMLAITKNFFEIDFVMSAPSFCWTYPD